jgi:hypothetical protein
MNALSFDSAFKNVKPSLNNKYNLISWFMPIFFQSGTACQFALALVLSRLYAQSDLYMKYETGSMYLTHIVTTLT